MKILVIEDEAELCSSIVAYFNEGADICEVATTYQQGREKVSLYAYDCVLLDLTLPGGSGLDLLQQIKENGLEQGIVIISARHSLDDKISGLNLGADDYLVKPFHLSELKARVMAVVRRKQFGGTNTLSFNEIHLNLPARNVYVQDQLVPLTRKEFDILLYFLANKGKVISKNALAEHLWGDEMDMADNYDFIYTHIKNLRKKLIASGAKDYVQSIYGLGYKLAE